MELEGIVKALVPSVEACRAKAESLRRAHPGVSNEALAQKAVQQAKTLLATTGALTGAVANPVAMVPLAAGELALVVNREAHLAGVIAALLDPHSMEDPDTFSADILAILFPGAVSQALGQFAVRAGQRTTKTLLRKVLTKDVLRAIIKFAARWLGLKLTQRAIITKAVPLVGAAIGAGWNWAEVGALGKRAITYYSEDD